MSQTYDLIIQAHPYQMTKHISELVQRRADLTAACRVYNEAWAAVQLDCPHSVILDSPGGYGYDAGGVRACFFCGVYEQQPIATPGDEYNYNTYGYYKLLDQRDGRTLYKVEREDVFDRRQCFKVRNL